MRTCRLICALIIGIASSGCVRQEYNTATGRQDIILINTDKEINMGRRIAGGIEENPDIVLDPDPLMTERVKLIGQRIAEVSDRKEVNYTFRIIDLDDVNAFALPGGYIFIFRGLIEKVETDDELASVIAHEVAHVVARHSVKRLQGGLGFTILQILMAVAAPSVSNARGINAAFGQLVMSYSREDEALADKIAVKYLRKAGFDPMAMISFLKKLQEVNREIAIRPYSSYRSHPYIADRIRMVKQEILGEIDFTDYMNKPID